LAFRQQDWSIPDQVWLWKWLISNHFLSPAGQFLTGSGFPRAGLVNPRPGVVMEVVNFKPLLELGWTVSDRVSLSQGRTGQS
jgi:hypothetical protein